MNDQDEERRGRELDQGASTPDRATAGADARAAGRGFLVITGAKAWFLVSASILNFGLPLLFATPADYGTYGVVVGAVSLLNMVVITASLQAVAKVVSEEPRAAAASLRRALTLQLGLALPLAALFALAAEPIADWLRDPAYAPLLRLSAPIIAAYGFYALFVGVFNGLKHYTRQAALDIVFATLRTVLILAAVALGFGVAGAIAGFVTASLIILVFSGLWVARTLRAFRREQDATPGAPSTTGDSSSGRRLLVFLVANLAYTFVLNLAMRVDLFVLKRLSADAASATSELSNALAGAYNLVVNIARLPYQAVIAIAFVIFPLLSRATYENDLEATRAWLRNTMRYALLLVGAFATVLAGAGPDLLRPLYPDYAAAGSALPALCTAYALFALLYVATTMLIAAGRPWLSTLLMSLTTVLLGVLCLAIIGAVEVGSPMLDGASVAVLLAMAAGLVGAGALSVRLYGAFLAPRSAIRLGLVILAVIALGRLTAFERFVAFDDPALGLDPASLETLAKTSAWRASRSLWLAAGLGKAAILGLAYVGLCVVTGELGAADRARLRGVLQRKRRKLGDTPP